MRTTLRRALPSTVSAYAPLAAILLVLTLASGLPSLAPHGLLPISGELVAWILIGGLAGFHRPLGGAASLGLGALVLPSAIERLGAVPAALSALFVFLAAEIGREVIQPPTVEGRTAGAGRRLARALAGVAPVAGATLVAGAATVLAESLRPSGAGEIAPL